MKNIRIAMELCALLVGSAFLSPSAFALGQSSAPMPLENPVSDGDLSDMRGGFFIAAGAQFDFGESVKTVVNGQLALQTNVNWTQTGVVVTQLSGLGDAIQSQVAANLANAGISASVNTSNNNVPAAASTVAPGPATPAPASSAAGAMPASSTAAVSTLGPLALTSTATAPPPSVNTAPFNNPVHASPAQTPTTTVATLLTTVLPTVNSGSETTNGVQITGPSGSTQILTNISAGQLQNIVINSASNQTISQNTNVTLTIYNFADWQKQLAQSTMSSRLVGEILAASGFGRSR